MKSLLVEPVGMPVTSCELRLINLLSAKVCFCSGIAPVPCDRVSPADKGRMFLSILSATGSYLTLDDPIVDRVANHQYQLLNYRAVLAMGIWGRWKMLRDG